MNKYLRHILMSLLVTGYTTCAAYAVEFDGGIDQNNKMIVSPTLAMRCIISSQDPKITSKCIEELVDDYLKPDPEKMKFISYKEERKAIVNDYVSEYTDIAVKAMVDSGRYDEKISELVCLDKTKNGCANPTNDINSEIIYNNKLSLDNSNAMLNALDLRISELQIDNVMTLLDIIVPNHEKAKNKGAQ